MNEPTAPMPADTRAAPTPADWCGPRRFALLLAALILAAFWKVLLGFETFAVRDFGFFSYPVACFQKECFWKGQLPWWNPLNCCGLPFLAQFNTLALYPFSLIYLLLPLTWSLPFFCLAHLFLGGMGMYFLASRWTGSSAGAALAGVAFAFNGLTLNFLMWPSHIATFAWLPWVILLTETGWREGGRKLVPAALAGAMEVLAGGPETILFTWLIVAALALQERRKKTVPAGLLARRFFLMGVLALCLSAVQWLPFADLAMHSSRNAGYAKSEWSMPAWGWANFLVPLFHTGPWQSLAVQPTQHWTSSYYVGIGTIFLAAVAVWRRREPRVWLLAAFVGASLVLALGDQGYVYLWLRHLFPVLGMFRYPIKFVIVTSALLPLLAAYGGFQYEREPGRALRPGLVCAGAIFILVGVIVCFTPQAWAGALSRLGLLAAAMLVVWFLPLGARWRRWSALALPLICWLDLVTAVPWQNPTLNPSVYQAGLGLMSAKLDRQPIPSDSRVMMSSPAARHLYYNTPQDLKTAYLLERSAFFEDCNLLDNVSKVDGFFSLYLREPDKILWMIDDRSGAELSALEDFLGVSETIAPGKLYAWQGRTNYLPIITAGQEPVFADDQTTLNAISRTNIDFRKTVYLRTEARSRVTAKAETAARATVKQFDNSKVVIQVDTPAAAMVNINQAYYHNWQAKVDGAAVPLWRANYAFQAVQVPQGQHELTLVYRDGMFRMGLILGAWAGLICLALWLTPKGNVNIADTSN